MSFMGGKDLMVRLLFVSLLGLIIAPVYSAAAQESRASAEQIVARATLPLAFENGVLSGPGAERLIQEAQSAQFVILIESHNDHATPLLTADLFRQLHQAHGFNYLAIEQDPFGMEAASDRSRRGHLDRIAAYARSYPYSYTFITDGELKLLAVAGQVSNARSQPIWGVDQVFGATALLEELLALSRTDDARHIAQALLQDARTAEDRRDEQGLRDQRNHHFVSSPAADLPRRLAELRQAMGPEPGTRAEELLNAIQISAEVYSYFHRARELDEAGAPLGLLNNWVREDWMKHRFMHHYRAAERAGDRQPRVLVKAGYWHAVRGRGPGNVFTLGNFLHEFAIANGNSAVSVQVLPLREWWPDHASVDQEYRVLVAADAMDKASLVDLRPLRPHLHMGNSFGLEGVALRTFRDLVFGVDFALFIPSKPGAYTLTAQ
jgi:hypothetical protein